MRHKWRTWQMGFSQMGFSQIGFLRIGSQRRARAAGFLALVLCLSLGADRARSADFQGVGDLPGSIFASSAFGISPDGQRVVGSGVSGSGTQGFLWEDGELMPLPIPAGTAGSLSYDVTSDGSVAAVGLGIGFTPFAVLWQDGAAQLLEDYPPATGGARAEAISANAGVIAGTAIAPAGVGFQAVRWINGQVGALAGGSMALAISNDGGVIAGFGGIFPGIIVPILWIDEEPEYLGALYSFSPLTEPRGISGSGEVVVGFALLGPSRDEDGFEAFRWEDGVYEPLGDLPGGGVIGSEAVDASYDGRIIVGSGTTDCMGEECTRAIFWNEQLVPIDLQDHLDSLGVDTTGWTLVSAEAVSDDGLTIVGTGINPDGFDEGYVAFLPEPPAGGLATAALASVWLLARRRSRPCGRRCAR